MKNFKDTRRYIYTLALILIISLFLAHTAGGVGPEPGSDGDPLVTMSYVDSEIAKILAQINSKINLLKSELRSTKNNEDTVSINNRLQGIEKTIEDLGNMVEGNSKYTKFEVVELETGKSIILGESAEIILRAGKALAIAGEMGDGLADITTDSRYNNLITDDIVPLNHLLLISRDDGRGIKAITKIWILVKGDYRIIDGDPDKNLGEDSDEDLDEDLGEDLNRGLDEND